MLRRAQADRRRPLRLLLLGAFVIALLPTAPAAAQSVDAVVDITFPVHDPDGRTTYSDTYDAPRSNDRRHWATDIGGASAYGLRVHAAVGGTVSWITRLDGANTGTAGYALGIRGDDGRTYRYMHLGRDGGPLSEAYAPGIRERGVRVDRGQHIGYLGDSGNASTSWPHLHFEICRANDCSSDRLNPYRSLLDAERRGDYPTGGAARPAGSGFTDVPSGHTHHAGITFVDLEGITRGCTVDRYCPDGAVTRGQMATFLHRALGLSSGQHSFRDVPRGHPHEAGIAAVAAAGIANGKGDGRFDPDAPVQRDQMATFLRNALDLPDSSTSFRDVPSSSPHAGAIGAIADAGITTGYRDGTFAPSRSVSRAQMASFLHRALD